MAIGSDIISNLGIGSGIQSNTIVSQLSDIERAPRQDRIDTKRDLYETQLSDYGLLKSALSTLQSAADSLGKVETFASKTASYNDSKIIIPEILDETATTGSYSFKVGQLAQAHSISIADSNAFSDPTDSVGKGTLNISFGNWVDADTYEVNADMESLAITIDDTNNSLVGLKDAINAADAGVQANIINDGVNGYKLVITGPSGANNQLKISVDENEASPTNVDNQGLSRFSFVEGASNRQLEQLTVGKDALFSVNGLDLVRSGNKIDDVIDGFTFTLAQEGTNETFTFDISEDKSFAENAIRDFVDAFNTFFTDTQPLTGFSEDEEGNGEFGSLYRDATARALMSNLRNMISQQVTAVSGDYDALTNVGVRTELDGSLSLNEKDFRNAIDNNFEAVKALFIPQTNSSSDKVTINGYGKQTVSGNYSLNITTQPAQGFLTGATISGNPLANLTTPTAGIWTGATATPATVINNTSEHIFDIDVDGIGAVTVNLLAGDYTNEAGLAAHIESQINANGTLIAAGKSVSVAWDTDHFVITSDSTGVNSSVTLSNFTGTLAGSLGLSTGSGESGQNSTGDYQFSVSVNGVTSNTIDLLAGSYANHNELAQHIQSQINGDTNLKASNITVSVTWDTDHFVVTSETFGSKSSVSFTNIGANALELGLASGTSTNGVDVAGTVEGKVGFGVGNVLLPKLDSAASGLSFLIAEGASTSTINFSRGFGSQFSQLIDSYLGNNGIFASKEASLNSNLDRLDDEEKNLDRRMEAFTARMQAQFIAMERILNSLNTTGDFLTGILDRLPLTAQNN